MSSEQFDLFLNACMAICALMALVNLLRVKSRMASSLLLAGAFLSLGVTIYLLKSAASQTWVFVGAAITGLCLVFDFAVRSSARKDLDEGTDKR